MRKLTYILLASALVIVCLSSCGDKTVKTDVPIPTEIAGFTLGEKYSENDCERIFMEYTELLVYMTSDKYGTGKMYNMFPASFYNREDFSFGGYLWTYIRLYVNKDDVLVSVEITASAEDYEPITEQYEKLKNVLDEKYGKARETKDKDKSVNCRWSDGTSLLMLAVSESLATDGSTRSFCSICYANKQLLEELNKSGNSEL